MNVTLIEYTPDPERLVAAAAKLCYSDSGCENIMDGLDSSGTQRFVNMLADMGHESPVEHVSFTFGIEGVSRTLLAQITRHRHASFSVQSQRYVKKENFVYITPPEISSDPEASKLFEESMKASNEAYRNIAEVLEKKHYERLISEGLTEKAAHSKAEKMAIEDARFVLPNACETKMVMTMNARSLINFFRLRCCNRAQWEIRELATEMYKICVEKAPSIFKNAGPSCLRGACSEGKMSCGKAQQVREKFEKIRENTLCERNTDNV